MARRLSTTPGGASTSRSKPDVGTMRPCTKRRPGKTGRPTETQEQADPATGRPRPAAAVGAPRTRSCSRTTTRFTLEENDRLGRRTLQRRALLPRARGVGDRVEAGTRHARTRSYSRACRSSGPGSSTCSAGTRTARSGCSSGRRAGSVPIRRGIGSSQTDDSGRGADRREERSGPQPDRTRGRGPAAGRDAAFEQAGCEGRLTEGCRRRGRWRSDDRRTQIRWSGRAERVPSRSSSNPGVFAPTHTSRTIAEALEIEPG